MWRRWRRWVPVTWRRRESSLASLGASDVASFGGVDEPAPDWPKCGQSPGGSTAVVAATHGGGGGWWWVMVVVVGRDGDVTMCDVSDVSTVVARFGNSRASIIN